MKNINSLRDLSQRTHSIKDREKAEVLMRFSPFLSIL